MKIRYWPRFLSFNTIEFLPGHEQAIKIKALKDAGELRIEFYDMRPILDGPEWMKVILPDKIYER